MTSPAKVRANTRRLDKLNIKITTVLAAMKRGEALLMEYRWHGRVWFLSGGRCIPDDIALIVIRNRSVVDVGDALAIDGALPQTWRRIED